METLEEVSNDMRLEWAGRRSRAARPGYEAPLEHTSYTDRGD